MRLKKCGECGKYTLKEKHCNKKTREAGYKYIKVKSSNSKK
jgi:rRNA maturation protein Nop10